MNGNDIEILNREFINYTSDELMFIFEKLEEWGWSQEDLPWIFDTYNRDHLLSECGYRKGDTMKEIDFSEYTTEELGKLLPEMYKFGYELKDLPAIFEAFTKKALMERRIPRKMRPIDERDGALKDEIRRPTKMNYTLETAPSFDGYTNGEIMKIIGSLEKLGYGREELSDIFELYTREYLLNL